MRLRTPYSSAQYAGRWCHSNQDVDAEEYVTRAGTGLGVQEDPDEGLWRIQALQEKLGVEADGFTVPKRSLVCSSTSRFVGTTLRSTASRRLPYGGVPVYELSNGTLWL